ncbi:pirin family protein [Aquimarina sp. AD10]|uniref:pirin family protein n=1 Tax=Aquimarina sp. AD10 TaxID=1714849 RepID=UPI000E50EAA0|nr:pirin family protein [Aquimarina sp. AD10]AXT59485.1 pirin family protein [Aquimarina sp. AD10]RKN00386.1 pirin family protein [Aquimarina sp. AD10]
MSNQGLIIEERSRDIGDFLVGRLIPFRKKRMVGPFIFIDHMGPTTIKKGHYMDVDQHPHIGLSTLTYMLDGELMHEDSIGTHQRISPGSVNWMVAGKGVTHTERTPNDLRDGSEFIAHGYQIWVALPKELEDIAPEFHHINASDLPSWKDKETTFRLIAGTGYGKTSPLPVHSELFMIEIKSKTAYELEIKGQLRGEIGICIVKGAIIACNDRIENGNMLVSKTEDSCAITLEPNTHILLFGGVPFPEERHIYWNFVSTSKDKIETAKQRWKNHEFPIVKGDDTYVPLPEIGF